MSLFQIFVYLLAAVIAVPFAKRLGLGSVLGYLIAGIIIGPSLLGVVGAGEEVAHIAEFGVVMMLFLIGLELRPSLLWRLRVPIVGLGGLQVLGVTTAAAGIALAAGLGWKQALAIGLIVAMSSTAIVLQSLAERDQLKLSAGQSCFSVLLFQDIAVIPILAILPLLGTGEVAASEHGIIAHLPPWLRALATIGTVVGLVLAGRFLLRPVFRYVAATRLREVFTEMTLLMGAVGLSAALGAFVAGVMLADSEYRHQLEADIEPFKGLLLGLFFITVGAGIDFTLIGARPGLIAALVAGIVLVKFVIQLPLARLFKLDWAQGTLFALALAQGGEFCFVLLAFAQGAGVLGVELVKPLTAAVALSMALTPLLFVLNDRVLQKMFRRHLPVKPEREADKIPAHDNPVILAGFGRFGHVVGRLLIANRIGCTVLENDPEQIEMLARFGLKAYYGDATRADLLHAAGAARAKLFICTLADEQETLNIVRMVQREFPHLRILARAVSRQHAYELIRAGVDDVFRETVGSALDLGVAALRGVGMRGVQALRAARLFKEVDEASVRELANYEGDESGYATRARQHGANLESVLLRDSRMQKEPVDDAWDNKPRER